MVEFLLFLIPSLIYVLVRCRSLGMQRAGANVGWQWGSWRTAGFAVALFPILLGLGYVGTRLVVSADLSAPGVVIVQGISLAVILRAVGEEIFFRGFLGGMLLRQLGFWVGNSIQAAIFLLPHLLLLTIDARLWPILPMQYVVGWILGALRHRSGSVIECGILHAALNTAIGMLVG
ncbi:CPBP family intramembrane glutamic endopeptidase [Corynebacterium hindlerae]|uniref:CPBP family intramembrane glutamic endopeptidase n=1 Tax=Corynebacterium hindlerae TaxID=699041 RepID=UPI003AAF2271